MAVLVTGAAGFIGFHVVEALLRRGDAVVGVDSLNAYYDVRLKEARLARLTGRPGFEFARLDIADRDAVGALAARRSDIASVIHLAAQAGVRHSLNDPYAYVQSNLLGSVVVLEAVRGLSGLRGVVYASSSSVYGANTKQPFSVEDRADHPVSLYAASKRATELIAESYSRLYGLALTGLRYFTCYGPWGRPDMAAWLFTEAILAGRPIRVFNEGRMARDFTYIDDIVAGTLAAHDRLPAAGGHRVYNLGNNRPEQLLDFIAALERALGQRAILAMAPMQPGDVAATAADIEASRRDLGFSPRISIEEGLARFVAWYREYHGPAMMTV